MVSYCQCTCHVDVSANKSYGKGMYCLKCKDSHEDKPLKVMPSPKFKVPEDLKTLYGAAIAHRHLLGAAKFAGAGTVEMLIERIAVLEEHAVETWFDVKWRYKGSDDPWRLTKEKMTEEKAKQRIAQWTELDCILVKFSLMNEEQPGTAV